MQLIIISGPSGSGKTTLSTIILKKLKDGIILNTDDYYKTGLISQILSKTVTSYFDRKINLEFILKNGFSNFSYEYDFKSKSIKKRNQKIKNIRFIIVEGIFGEEIIKSLSGDDYILINLKINKQSCMKRVIKRDFEERGKNKNLAKRDFIKAWELFHKNKKENHKRNYLKKIDIKNQSEIQYLLKNLTNIVH